MKSAIAVTFLVLGICAFTASAVQLSQCVGQFSSTKAGTLSTCVTQCCLCQLVKNAAASSTATYNRAPLPYNGPYNKIAAINALLAQIQQGSDGSSCYDPCLNCPIYNIVEPPFQKPPRTGINFPQPQPIAVESSIPEVQYLYEAEQKK